MGPTTVSFPLLILTPLRLFYENWLHLGVELLTFPGNFRATVLRHVGAGRATSMEEFRGGKMAGSKGPEKVEIRRWREGKVIRLFIGRI